MKYALFLLLLLPLSTVRAQKSPPTKSASARKYTPPNTYRLSEKSDIVYADIDNMPILLPQVTDNMPTASHKPGRDSISVYRMPNPLRREARPVPEKP